MNEAPAALSPPRRRRASQARSKATVQRILDAATALIAENGAHAVTMSDIARRAGMVIGTLYQYFVDRTAIFRAILINHQAQARELLHHHVGQARSHDDLIEALVQSFDAYYAMLQRDRLIAGLWSMVQADPELQAIDIADTMANARYVATVAARFDPEADPDPASARHALLIQFSMYAGMLALQTPGALARDIAPAFRTILRAALAVRDS